MSTYKYIENYDPLSLEARKKFMDDYLKSFKYPKKERNYLRSL